MIFFSSKKTQFCKKENANEYKYIYTNEYNYIYVVQQVNYIPRIGENFN